MITGFYSMYYKTCTLWWRHQMETFSALLIICVGNSPVAGEFPAQRPVTRSFDVFFDLRLNKRLSKQSWVWWFETSSRPLWRHCNGTSEIHPTKRAFHVYIKNRIKKIIFVPIAFFKEWMPQYILSLHKWFVCACETENAKHFPYFTIILRYDDCTGCQIG